jgi:hypothetical protein
MKTTDAELLNNVRNIGYLVLSRNCLYLWEQADET